MSKNEDPTENLGALLSSCASRRGGLSWVAVSTGVICFWLGWFLASHLDHAEHLSPTVGESGISDHGSRMSKQSQQVLVQKEASDISGNADSDLDPSKRRNGQAFDFSRDDVRIRDSIWLLWSSIAIAVGMLGLAVMMKEQKPMRDSLPWLLLGVFLPMQVASQLCQITMVTYGQPTTSDLNYSTNDRVDRSRGE